jgi:acyl carrier protein
LQAELHNLYGPTEAAVDVTYWACDPEATRQVVPIGRPIANTQIHILDSQLQRVPVGVRGELYIGGVNVARGYVMRPDMTAEKFIPDPFGGEAGARLYKTGDLARYLTSGEIEYLGRIDHQVKIRGFRIELDEIQSLLNLHPAIRDSVVALHQAHDQDKRLVAYVVAEAGREVQVAEVRAYLKEKLPDYMVPAAFVTLDAMPLSPNGKIDRRMLPSPDEAEHGVAAIYVAPRTPLEESIAQAWQDALGVERVGAHDNFFELGGHSLLAMRIVSRLRDSLEIDLVLRDMFESPTVEQLAAVVEQIFMREVEELSEDEAQRLLELED